MWDCPHCDEVIPGKDKPTITRCPHCREPLFEKPGGPKLVSETGESDRGICAIHKDNVAIGTCKRCGNFLCPVCRTKWQDRVLCVACVERLMGADTVNPQERRSHLLQAKLSLILGIVGWVSTLVAAIPLALVGEGQNTQSYLTFAIMLGSMSLFPSLFGAGQATAAIRARGHQMMMATMGLVLCCSHIGVMLGLILIRVGRV